MKKTLALLLALLLLCGPLAGCSSQTSTEAPPEEETVEQSAETWEFTDSAGRTVTLPTVIDRVAVSGSLAQTFVFPIVADKLVGLAGDFSDEAKVYIPEKYTGLPVLGQFYGKGDLNLESVIAADPQIVIDAGEAKDTIVEDMDGITEKTNIPTVFIAAALESLDVTYTTLGEVLGMQAEAKALADYASKAYADTKAGLDTVAQKKTILYLTGEKGLNVIAQGSYHAQVINLVGDNLAVIENPTSSGSGDEVTMEQILNWNPDVIVFAPNGAYELAQTDSAWAALKAVQNGDIYEAPGAPYNWLGFPPGANTLLGMQWLAKALYPEVFTQDLKPAIVEYYKLFFHSDLTDAQYDELTANAFKK